MPRVEFTSLLLRFFPDLEATEVSASTMKEVLDELDGKYHGLSEYLIHENGGLRQHVNIFINGNMVQDRIGLTDVVEKSDTINIIQALSGG